MVVVHKALHHEKAGRTLPLPHDTSYPDSLDFLLHSVYNNAGEFNSDKAGIRVQPESSIKHTKALCHNVTDTHIPPKVDSQPQAIRVAEMVNRRHENQCKSYTDSVHASQTNNGYSRQRAGGYFRWS